MCGIAGLVEPGGTPARAEIEAMTSVLEHRGPDDLGFHEGPEVALGFRRLAIIDLETGNQPVTNERRSVWAVFNGEIYNYRELRRRLQAAGHRFESSGDSEVLPHLYEERGPEMVHDLRGMFAFGLWDAERRELVLARDRLGEKPLYYSADALPGRRFAFASEIKGILAAGARREPDPRAIAEYLHYLYVPAPRSAFAGIQQLPPGHLLRHRAGSFSVTRYWRPRLEVVDRPDGEHVEGVRTRVHDAVGSRLAADVPLGAFLSGGVDSSSVVAAMTAVHPGPTHTFTISFEGLDRYDESEAARATARHFGTTHHELSVKVDPANSLQRVVESFDEPFGNATATLIDGLAERTREHVKVALTGDGADELFGGYPRYRGAQAGRWYRQAPLGPVRRVAGRLAHRLSESTTGAHGRRRLREFLTTGQLPVAEAYADWVGYFTPELLGEILVDAAPGDPRDFLLGLLGSDGDPDVNDLSLADLESFLPFNVLAYADRMSMRHGLELRAPFVDHLLVEYVETMPAGIKLRGKTSKWALREAMAPRLPGQVLGGRKRGLNPPLGHWLAGPLAPVVDELLSPAAVERRGWLRPEVVQRLLEEHRRGRRDRSQHIWGLLVLETWFRIRIDRLVGIERGDRV